MTDSEGEIEYLDEDADVVHQYMQNAHEMKSLLEDQDSYIIEVKKPKLKRKIDTDDSDYDPQEDIVPLKRRTRSQISQLKAVPVKTKIARPVFGDLLAGRKKMNIRMPDFEDPLCMSVKLIPRNFNEALKLKSWNSACLQQLKKVEEPFKLKSGESVKSVRTVTLSLPKNKADATVESKLTVQSATGEQQTEVFKAELPPYSENKTLNVLFSNLVNRPRKLTSTKSTVLLTKETYKDEQCLVSYKPEEAISSVFKFTEGIVKNKSDLTEDIKKRYLEETAVTKMCGYCYHMSWRPTRTKGVDNNIKCSICSRNFLSVYNYLTHVKTHKASQIVGHKRDICALLAKNIEYHYKCRVCLKKFPTIKTLRFHIKTHKASEPIICEVGNHIVK